MALTAIVGDSSFLGYAFDAEGFVSPSKLTGAVFAIFAHILLLSYGDDQARRIAYEPGIISSIILRLRGAAKVLTARLPEMAQRSIRAKPVGIPFTMLALNGVGLMADAVIELPAKSSIMMDLQMLVGLLVVFGSVAFAIADFVKTQKVADILTKIGPSLLSCCTLATAGLTLATLNPFLVIGTLAFGICNLAAFFTRVQKT